MGKLLQWPGSPRTLHFSLINFADGFAVPAKALEFGVLIVAAD